MGYRDEEDALRARNEALESELSRSKEERARLEAQHRQELLQARGIVPIPPAPSRRSPTALIAMLGALVMVCFAGGASFFLLRSTRGASTGGTLPASSVAHAVWHGKVRSATGAQVAVGAECRLESALRYHTAAAASGSAYGASMKVTCGGVTLFDSQDPTGHGASSTLELDDRSKPVSQGAQLRTFELDYDEHGPASRQRPMITLSTSRGVALLTRELPALRVELVVTPGSDPTAIATE